MTRTALDNIRITRWLGNSACHTAVQGPLAPTDGAMAWMSGLPRRNVALEVSRTATLEGMQPLGLDTIHSETFSKCLEAPEEPQLRGPEPGRHWFHSGV